jgi:hypothetical protein
MVSNLPNEVMSWRLSIAGDGIVTVPSPKQLLRRRSMTVLREEWKLSGWPKRPKTVSFGSYGRIFRLYIEFFCLNGWRSPAGSYHFVQQK